jgi:hypothetical protein
VVKIHGCCGVEIVKMRSLTDCLSENNRNKGVVAINPYVNLGRSLSYQAAHEIREATLRADDLALPLLVSIEL